MSRLDANGRWDTKMMTPEFKEQYQQRNDPRPNGPATAEELELINDAIVLPHMLTISERALADVQQSTNTYKTFLARLTRLFIDRIGKEHQRVRKQLWEHNIKLYPGETEDGVIYCQYRRRDYDGRHGIAREQLKAMIEKRLLSYGGWIMDQMEETSKARASQYNPADALKR